MAKASFSVAYEQLVSRYVDRELPTSDLSVLKKLAQYGSPNTADLYVRQGYLDEVVNGTATAELFQDADKLSPFELYTEMKSYLLESGELQPDEARLLATLLEESRQAEFQELLDVSTYDAQDVLVEAGAHGLTAKGDVDMLLSQLRKSNDPKMWGIGDHSLTFDDLKKEYNETFTQVGDFESSINSENYKLFRSEEISSRFIVQSVSTGQLSQPIDLDKFLGNNKDD